MTFKISLSIKARPNERKIADVAGLSPSVTASKKRSLKAIARIIASGFLTISAFLVVIFVRITPAAWSWDCDQACNVSASALFRFLGLTSINWEGVGGKIVGKGLNVAGRTSLRHRPAETRDLCGRPKAYATGQQQAATYVTGQTSLRHRSQPPNACRPT